MNLIFGGFKSYQIYIYQIVNNCIMKQKKTNQNKFVFEDILY